MNAEYKKHGIELKDPEDVEKEAKMKGELDDMVKIMKAPGPTDKGKQKGNAGATVTTAFRKMAAPTKAMMNKFSNNNALKKQKPVKKDLNKDKEDEKDKDEDKEDPNKKEEKEDPNKKEEKKKD